MTPLMHARMQVMCLPKHYVKPMPSPQQLSALYPADMAGWGELYQGE